MLLVNTFFVLAFEDIDKSSVDRMIIVIDVFTPGEKILKE